MTSTTTRSSDGNEDNVDITIILANDCTIKFQKNQLINISEYFTSMFAHNDFQESVSNTVNLSHLNSTILQYVLDLLITQNNSSINFCKQVTLEIESKDDQCNILKNDKWEEEYYTSIVCIIDYLQITAVNENDLHRIIQAISIYKTPDILRDELKKDNWISKDSPYNVISIPNNKKKREWRFWVLYILCLDILPNENKHIEPITLLQSLTPLGDAIALRRELIEYNLLDRVGDGSAYWRPKYTLFFIYNQLHKQDTGTFQRKVI